MGIHLQKSRLKPWPKNTTFSTCRWSLQGLPPIENIQNQLKIKEDTVSRTKTNAVSVHRRINVRLIGVIENYWSMTITF